MFKKFVLVIAVLQVIGLFLYCFRGEVLWAADTFEGAFAVASSTTNVPCTTNSPLLTFDPTRVHWNLHPEGTTGVRIVPGLSNGNPSTTIPTASVGEELVGGGYFDSTPWTNPQLSWVCTSEGGSVTVSVEQDYKY